MPPKKPKPMKVVPFRLPAELVKRLDDHAARLTKAGPPGLRVTRADALRILLAEAFGRLDRK